MDAFVVAYLVVLMVVEMAVLLVDWKVELGKNLAVVKEYLLAAYLVTAMVVLSAVQLESLSVASMGVI
jgi:hypothetical protein